MTSLTPRYTFSSAGTSAQSAPAAMLASKVMGSVSQSGSGSEAATTAPTSAAMRYCPSTPMLNSPMRSENAAAMPAK
ncbi:MAG: hypothetical protein J0I95_08295 [Microbacterium sp.]|nr:hypothetical protein [Microbacterium sp.]MBN9211496.1 hypothetical protein [Microbacterium sp.]